VNLFGTRDAPSNGSVQSGDPDEVLAKLDKALTAIFSEDGKRTVLYYLTSRFNLSLEQASLDPTKLERALTGLLGEVGWMVVKRAILEEFWDKKIGINETVLVERASLREAFGFVRGLGFGSFMAK
jgi:hypothetical protein